MTGALKDFGAFCSHPTQPSLRTYRAREIEDLGGFGVFWYERPTGHTKTGARHHGETPTVTQWAWVRKSDDGSWQVGHAVPGFESRDVAIQAAREAVQ